MRLFGRHQPTAEQERLPAFDGHVQRIQTDHGSHVEPPFNEAWDELTKLRWEAAVTEADTGLRIRVSVNSEQPPTYSLLVGHSSVSAFRYSSAWTFLTGVTVGAQQKQASQENADVDN